MGWSQRIEGSAMLTSKDVEDVLDAIDAQHVFEGKWSRQSWGWSSECDVYKDEQADIHFGGSWSISGQTNLPERFTAELKRRGFSVSLTERR